ncbi:MAG: hypothetical protein WDN04_20880 [Rhodospirillales bacterium]
MLYAALAALCVALPLGMWLGSLHLVREEPPRRLGGVGVVHGLVGATCVALLFLALRSPDRRGAAHGAGGFGWIAFWVLAATLAGGLTIFVTYLRGKPVSPTLVAAHATAGIAGAVMLAAYFATPTSFGR